MEIIYSFICVVLPCVVYFLFKKRESYRLPFWAMLIFLVYIWQVYELTGVGGLNSILYAPKGGDKESIIQATINLVPFNSIELTFFLNILMLVPLGFLVPFFWKSYRKFYKVIVLGAGFSLMIELSQLITNRTTDVNDLLANTIGACIGYILWKLFVLCFGTYMKKTPIGNGNVIWYIALSFMGQFFLYYPFWFEWTAVPFIFGG